MWCNNNVLCWGGGSIEDAKQKAEHNRRLKQAELKKNGVKKEVGRLRRTFLQLFQRNEQLPLPLQLPADEFIMDPSLEAGMRERAGQQVRMQISGNRLYVVVICITVLSG